MDNIEANLIADIQANKELANDYLEIVKEKEVLLAAYRKSKQ